MANDNMPAGCTEDDGFGILPEPMEDPDYVPDVFDAERYMDYFTKKYHMDSDSSADDIQNRIMDASDSGDYRGSKACAIALEEGRGVDVDYAAARHYYEKGTEEFSNYSEGFDEEMQFRWGRLIYNGLGGEADKEEGAYMMRSAVEETHYVDWDDPNGIRDLMKRWGIKKYKSFIETVRYSYGIPQED